VYGAAVSSAVRTDVGEMLHRIAVQLAIGALAAYALIYLRTAEWVRGAEVDRATAELVAILDGERLSAFDEWIPRVYKLLAVGLGAAIIAGVYTSFAVRWRALLIVAVLSLAALALLATGPSHAPIVQLSVVAGVGAAIALTIWHERWLGDYDDAD
jgi:hypothetical protein